MRAVIFAISLFLLGPANLLADAGPPSGAISAGAAEASTPAEAVSPEVYSLALRAPDSWSIFHSFERRSDGNRITSSATNTWENARLKGLRVDTSMNYQRLQTEDEVLRAADFAGEVLATMNRSYTKAGERTRFALETYNFAYLSKDQGFYQNLSAHAGVRVERDSANKGAGLVLTAGSGVTNYGPETSAKVGAWVKSRSKWTTSTEARVALRPDGATLRSAMSTSKEGSSTRVLVGIETPLASDSAAFEPRLGQVFSEVEAGRKSWYLNLSVGNKAVRVRGSKRWGH